MVSTLVNMYHIVGVEKMGEIGPKLFGPSPSKEISEPSNSAFVLINEDDAWTTVLTFN